MTTFTKARVGLASAVIAAAVTLAGCSTSDPAESSGGMVGDGVTLVVGSQDYYSNEIIAELYAQALEAQGYTIDRQYRIGQREVYIPEIESGAIDVFPEYTGNLLQYYVPDTTATTSADVYAELSTSLPAGLRVLDQSDASDQDSYNVTTDFSATYGVKSLADLEKVGTPITLGGNSELATRPYGPDGLKSVYGVEVGFTPIEDGGGPLTLKALLDDDVQMVNIYSGSPMIGTNGLVTLADPEGLFLASQVVPVVSAKVDDAAAAIINAVSAALTAEGLVALNVESVDNQTSAADIAAAWLAENPISVS